MSERESTLLARYARQRDAEAFHSLVRRYEGMVFAACHRVLGNRADAEDAVQNCFLQLARAAGRLKAPVAGWLHTVAVRVSIDMLRANRSRRARERQVMARRMDESEATWPEIRGEVDEAVAALPERLRLPLVMHYLQERKQTEIASELGVAQSEVSRRLHKAVDTLRKRLGRSRLIVSSAGLSALLAGNAVEAAPAALSAALGKLALSGASAGGPAGAVPGTLSGLSSSKLLAGSIALGAILLLSAGIYWVVARSRVPSRSGGAAEDTGAAPPRRAAPVAQSQPGVPGRGAAAQAERGYEDLLRAHIRGDHEYVLASAEVRGAQGGLLFDDFRSARLRARAAEQIFWRDWKLRAPRPEEAAAFRAMTTACTRAYEEALVKAPTQLDRARISAAWWRLNGVFEFNADSRALRAPLEGTQVASAEGAAARLRRANALRSAVLQSLEDWEGGSKAHLPAPVAGVLSMLGAGRSALLTPDMREQVAALFAEQWQRLDRFRIPEELFDALLRDVGPFVSDVLMPYYKHRRPAPQTVRWYLWQGLARPAPDEIERGILDGQVREFARFLQERTDGLLVHPQSPPPGRHFAEAFLGAYRRYGDNAFFPYYRQASTEARLAWIKRKVAEYAEECASKFPRRAQQIEQNEDAQARRRQLADQQLLYGEAIYILAWTWFAHFDLPSSKRSPSVPGIVCYGSWCNVNQSGLIVMGPSDTRPMQAFRAQTESEP